MFELQTELEFSYFTLSHCDLHECAASSMPSLKVILIRIDGADQEAFVIIELAKGEPAHTLVPFSVASQLQASLNVVLELDYFWGLQETTKTWGV